MGDDDRRELFERLEALERMVRSRHEDRGSRDDHRHGDRHREHRGRGRHDRDHDRGGDGDFEEKRIIDTIVCLVTEQVGRILDERQASAPRADDGGGDKRIVDLIVGLVSEHVQEIVSNELDRRFGRADAPRDGGGPPTHDASDPEQR